MVPSNQVVCTNESTDFQKAINYVKKVKLRFQEQPFIYQQFKKMIIRCQKCMKSQTYDRTKFLMYFDMNLNANIQGLFQNHADLVQEFEEFYKHFVKAPVFSFFENNNVEVNNEPACLKDLKIIDVPENMDTSKPDKTMKTQYLPIKDKDISYFEKNKSLPERFSVKNDLGNECDTSAFYCNICSRTFLELPELENHMKTDNICNPFCALTEVVLNSNITLKETEESDLVIEHRNNKINENLPKDLDSNENNNFVKSLTFITELSHANHPKAILAEQQDISCREVKLRSDLNLKECYVKLERINLSKYLNNLPKKRELNRLQIFGTLGPKKVGYKHSAGENCQEFSKTRGKKFSYYEYNSDEENEYFLGCVTKKDDNIFSQLDKKTKRKRRESCSQNLDTYQSTLKKSTIVDPIVPLDRVNKKMLLVMFKGLLNLENEDGRCISESLICLPNFVEVDGQRGQALSFGILKNRILEGFYNNMDQFQDDLFAVLEIGQKFSCNSSTGKDSERLKEEYIKVRNKLWGDERSVCLLDSKLEHIRACQ